MTFEDTSSWILGRMTSNHNTAAGTRQNYEAVFTSLTFLIRFYCSGDIHFRSDVKCQWCSPTYL